MLRYLIFRGPGTLKSQAHNIYNTKEYAEFHEGYEKQYMRAPKRLELSPDQKVS
jgi:hypothetical protein